jgi:large conductance mechanosensitive channel
MTMSLAKEFREFAVKGNVIDLAVGVIIGGAFGKIVTSLVGDVVMPFVGLFVGGVNFTSLAFSLKEGNEGAPPVLLKYGQFLQNVFDFLIVAGAVFFMVKAINTLKRKHEAAPPPAPPAPTPTETLLAEIRDLLKAQSSRTTG